MILALTFTEASVIGLLVAAVQFGTLLYLAALGETITEKAGVLNLGVEGMMATGAAVGFIAGVESGSPWVGLLAGALAGAALSMVHAIAAVGLGADQVVSGLALTFLGLGLANYVGDGYTDDARRSRFVDIEIPGLDDIPWVGEVVFRHSPVTYLAVIAGIGAWFVLNRTSIGLGLRAVGETASTADAAGHSVTALRFSAVAIGGAFAGMSGAYLTTYLVQSWSQNLTGGRGWIAVALVIFGAWRPGRGRTRCVALRIHVGTQESPRALRGELLANPAGHDALPFDDSRARHHLVSGAAPTFARTRRARHGVSTRRALTGPRTRG